MTVTNTTVHNESSNTARRGSFADFVAEHYQSPLDIVYKFHSDISEAAASIRIKAPDEIKFTGSWEDAENLETGKNDKRQGYLAEIERRKDGLTRPVITFHSFRSGGLHVKWTPDDLLYSEYQNGNHFKAHDPSKYKIKADKLEKEHAQKRAIKEKLDIEGRNAVAKTAAKLFHSLENATEHKYLTDKNVKPHGIKLATTQLRGELYSQTKGKFFTGIICEAGDLIIPLYRNDKIVSLQRIAPDGSKRFLPGGSTIGAYYLIKGTKTGGKAFVAEGFATAATVSEATGHDTYVAFSANNLHTVSKENSNIKVVASDANEAGIKGAKSTGLSFYSPDAAIGDDWNDYAQAKGLEAVKQALQGTVMGATAPTEPPVNKEASTIKSLSPNAKRLAEQINHRIAEGLDDLGVSEVNITADPSVIDAMIQSSFWSGAHNRLHFLTEDQSLVQYPTADAVKFLGKRFGAILCKKTIEKALESVWFGNIDRRTGRESAAGREKRRKFISNLLSIATESVFDYIRYHNQRNNLEWRVDMFASSPRIKLLEEKAQVILTHEPFHVSNAIDLTVQNEVVADYKEHFTRFDKFLYFLIAARFATDRKKAYLWLHADSDWGKGFLMDGILGGLDLTVPMSVREVEGIFEGKPAGKSPADFKRAFALVVDEFKSVKSEIKQLQSHLDLAPKFQLTSRVEIFAKVFMSAESVGSLVTSEGVEDQFANRMSVFREKGSIEDREAFKRIGKAIYSRALRNYVAKKLNDGVEEMRKLGRVKAEKKANDYLDGFIRDHGLDTLYERTSNSLEGIAAEAVAYFMGTSPEGKANMLENRFSGRLEKDNASGDYFLLSPRKSLDIFLHERFDRSEVMTFSRLKIEILAYMCIDGRGDVSHRINGKTRKAVKLKKLGA